MVRRQDAVDSRWSSQCDCLSDCLPINPSLARLCYERPCVVRSSVSVVRVSVGSSNVQQLRRTGDPIGVRVADERFRRANGQQHYVRMPSGRNDDAVSMIVTKYSVRGGPPEVRVCRQQMNTGM